MLFGGIGILVIWVVLSALGLLFGKVRKRDSTNSDLDSSMGVAIAIPNQ